MKSVGSSKGLWQLISRVVTLLLLMETHAEPLNDFYRIFLYKQETELIQHILWFKNSGTS